MSSPIPTPLSEFAVSTLFALIVSVIAVVIGELALYPFLKKLEKPKMEIEPISKVGYLFGFSVTMIKKNVINARVLCNGKECMWEDEKKGKIDKKDLFAGGKASIVLPFEASVQWVEDVKKYPHFNYPAQFKGTETGGIVLRIKEVADNEIVFTNAFPVPILKLENGTVTGIRINANHDPYVPIPVTFTIIGEGIEEKRDYCASAFLQWVDIPVFKEGKPDLDYISTLFILKKKKHLSIF
jgi:hypothetical protein